MRDGLTKRIVASYGSDGRIVRETFWLAKVGTTMKAMTSAEARLWRAEMAAEEAKNPHAVILGRKGGKATSAAKTKAVRENGKKGGRPKKVTRG